MATTPARLPASSLDASHGISKRHASIHAQTKYICRSTCYMYYYHASLAVPRPCIIQQPHVHWLHTKPNPGRSLRHSKTSRHVMSCNRYMSSTQIMYNKGNIYTYIHSHRQFLSYDTNLRINIYPLVQVPPSLPNNPPQPCHQQHPPSPPASPSLTPPTLPSQSPKSISASISCPAVKPPPQSALPSQLVT